MREIKFRAWEPLNKKMHYMEFCLWEKVGYNDNKGFALPVGKQGVTGSYTIMNLEALEIMQYTGLKDKNGKEVYEGDICKGGVGNFIVYWKDGAFRIVKTDDKSYGGWLNKSEADYMEVIGNIYENPELIPPLPTLEKELKGT